MESSIQKGALFVFSQNDRSGLKNDSDKIIVPAEYDEIIVGMACFIGIKFCDDDCDDWFELTEAFVFDSEGKKIACISDAMRRNGYNDFRDVYHIAKDIFCFTHTNNDGYEVLGLFGSLGNILLPPRYDELHTIDDIALLGYYSPRFHEFEFDWEEDDSFTLLSISGEILWHGLIEGHSYDDNDSLFFITKTGENLIIENNRRVKIFKPFFENQSEDQLDEEIACNINFTESFGVFNTIVTIDRYEELKRFFISNLNTGKNYELLACSVEIGAFFIDAGVRKFEDFAKIAIQDIGEIFVPYLMSSYLGAKYLPPFKKIVDLMDSESSAEKKMEILCVKNKKNT